MLQHVKVLAWLHIAFGILGILLGIGALLLFGGLAGLVAATDHNSDATTGMAILGVIGVVVLIVALVLSIPGLIAGIGLLNFRPWARILAIVISALDLLHVPFGTALGIYGLWVLLSPEGEALFSRAPIAATGWRQRA
jgi:hypothetical protein